MLAALSAALLLTMLDNTLVSVAVPSLQDHLHAGIGDLQWVVASYILVFAALLLTGGVLADLLGRRRVLCTGLAVFAGGSVVAAMAGSIHLIVAGRVIQGLGAALTEPATLAIIRAEWRDPAPRVRALGTWAAVSGLALALGPLLGGVLTWQWGWRAVFWVNVPIAVVALMLVFAWVPHGMRHGARPGWRDFDPLGQALSVAALGATSWGLIDGGDGGFGQLHVLVFLSVGVLGAVGFVATQRWGRSPSIPPGLLRDRAVGASLLVAFATSVAIFAVFFFVTLYLQLIAGASPLTTAGRFAPMVLATIGAGALSGRLAARIGARVPVTAGLIVAAVGFGLVNIAIAPHGRAVALGAAVGIVGIGIGVTLAPMVATVLDHAEPERAGTVAALVNLSREVGGLIGVGVLGGIVVTQLDRTLAHRLHQLGVPSSYGAYITNAITHGTSPDGGQAAAAGGTFGGIVTRVVDAAEGSFAHGLHVALWSVAALLLATAAASARWIPGRPPGSPPYG